jgi:hypothetical protein
MRRDETTERHFALEPVLECGIGLRRKVHIVLDEILSDRVNLNLMWRKLDADCLHIGELRAIICGSTARINRGSGSTMWAKTERHSSSLTSMAGVVGAGKIRDEYIDAAGLLYELRRQVDIH